jgi:hypothetical protein
MRIHFWRAYLLSLLSILAACSTPLSRPVEGWWSEDRPARPAWPASRVLIWAAHRPLAHDTLIHEFVRELLAQGQPKPSFNQGDTLTTFYLGRTLFDHNPGAEPQWDM